MITVPQNQNVGWAQVRSARTALAPAGRSTVPTASSRIHMMVGKGVLWRAPSRHPYHAFAHPTASEKSRTR